MFTRKPNYLCYLDLIVRREILFPHSYSNMHKAEPENQENQKLLGDIVFGSILILILISLKLV